MRPLFVCLGLTACLQPVSPNEIGDPCPSGTAEATIDGQPAQTSSPAADGQHVIIRCRENGRITAWGAAIAPAKVTAHAVGSFTALSGQLGTARARHSATRLPDGRVYVAGGFDGTQALASTEMFHPESGTFSAGVKLGLVGAQVELPRAFHTAVALPSGQVLLHGGETYASGMTFASPATLIYDDDHMLYGLVRPRTDPPSVARTRHLAVPLSDGSVLLAGGVGTDGKPVPEVEVYDANAADVNVVDGATLPRTGAAGVWDAAKGAAAIVGGSDGSSDVTTVAYVTTSGMKGTAMLAAPHPDAQAFVHGDDVVVASAGGAELLDVTSGALMSLPALTASAGACSVATSSDVWVVIGGPSANGVEWVSGAPAVMAFDAPPTALKNHTCTLLADGTVLVAGGSDASGAVIAGAWIFTPPLTD